MPDAKNKKKNISSADFQLNRQHNKKVKVNSEYYREYQRTCNVYISDDVRENISMKIH